MEPINFKDTKMFTLRIFKIHLFSYCSIRGLGWFRIFGVGLHWKDCTIHKMYFSERNGFVKYLKFGKWIIKFLPYSKIYKP